MKRESPSTRNCTLLSRTKYVFKQCITEYQSLEQDDKSLPSFTYIFDELPGNLQRSLQHFFNVYGYIARSAVKHAVVYPLCVAHLKKENPKLVFPNLKSLGYTMGIPTDFTIRSLFLQELTVVVLGLHDAQVVHLDLNPANIFWKLNTEGDAVEIKLVDLDLSQLTFEPLFDVNKAEVQEGPRAALQTAYWQIGHSPDDLTVHDLSYLKIIEMHLNDERLQQTNSETLSANFKQIVSEEMQNKLEEFIKLIALTGKRVG
jgi:serine/threonine protein kinase